MMLREPEVAIPPPREGDVRVGHLLGKALQSPEEARILLVGFPSDEGIRRNQGRLGAAHAPDRIREQLFACTPDARWREAFEHLLTHTWDLGNAVLRHSLEESQAHFGELLGPYLKRGCRVIVLGGGHETAYGHFLGYVNAELPVRIVNWDAHLDVRPLLRGLGHSGSPFRQALEHPGGYCRGYQVVGALPQSVSPEHLAYVQERGGQCIWREEITPSLLSTLYEGEQTLMVSFDMDALDQAFAPGVSAPAAGGLTPDIWLRAAFLAGHTPAVRSMDVVECSPRLDVDQRTVRMAAVTVWHFLSGMAARISGH